MTDCPLVRLAATAEANLDAALERRDQRLQDTERELREAREDLRMYRNLLALAPFSPTQRLLQARIPAQRRPTR